MAETPNSEWTYAEVLAEELTGENVQLYTGESTGTINYADYDVEQKAIIKGKVVGAKGQMLILDCVVRTGMQNFETRVYINGWYIKGASRLDDGVSIAMIFDNNETLRSKR
jgi:hypothetical protein